MDLQLCSPDSQELKFLVNQLMLLVKLKAENKVNLTYSGEENGCMCVPQEQKHKTNTFNFTCRDCCSNSE